MLCLSCNKLSLEICDSSQSRKKNIRLAMGVQCSCLPVRIDPGGGSDFLRDVAGSDTSCDSTTPSTCDIVGAGVVDMVTVAAGADFADAVPKRCYE